MDVWPRAAFVTVSVPRSLHACHSPRSFALLNRERQLFQVPSVGARGPPLLNRELNRAPVLRCLLYPLFIAPVWNVREDFGFALLALRP